MGDVADSMTRISAGGLLVLPAYTPNLVAVLVGLATTYGLIVVAEFCDWHVPYSKFAAAEERNKLPTHLLRSLFTAESTPQHGFLVLYVTPLASYVGLFTYFALANMRETGQIAPSPAYSIALLIGWVLSFSKRCLEVLFVHIYSGKIPTLSTAVIAVGYTAAGLAPLIWSNQVEGYALGPDSNTFIKDIVCLVCYMAGISVNFYAHLKLRWVRLRASDSGEKRYYSPAEIGWPFSSWIVCPHYTWETLMFIAWGVFGATPAHYATALAVSLYLAARTRATYKWYAAKGLLGSGRQDRQSVAAKSIVVSSGSDSHSRPASTGSDSSSRLRLDSL